MSHIRDFLMLSTGAPDLQLRLGQLNVERSNNSSLFPLPTFSCYYEPNPTLNEYPCNAATDIFQEQERHHGPFWHNTCQHQMSRVDRRVQSLPLYPQNIVTPNQENRRYCPYHNPNPNALNNSTVRRNGRGSMEQYTTSYRSSGCDGNMEQLSALIRERRSYMRERGVMPVEQEVDSASRIPASRVASTGGRQSNANIDRMPCVSTMGANGRSTKGILFKFNRWEYRIMCICHGRNFSPGEFVRHAGTIECSNPLGQIMIVPY